MRASRSRREPCSIRVSWQLPDSLAFSPIRTMAALMALLTYYIALLTTPTPTVAWLIAVSSSPRLNAVYKTFKWILRVGFRRGNEIQRVLKARPAHATGYIRLPQDEPSDPVNNGSTLTSSAKASSIVATWRIGMSCRLDLSPCAT